MKEGRKEFRKAFFQSPLEEKVFSGEGSKQVGRRPNLQGIRPLRAHWCVYSQPLTASSPCPPALHWRRRILPRGQSSAVWGFLLLWLEWIRNSPGLQLQPGDHWGSCAPVLPLRAVWCESWNPAPKSRPSEREKWNANKEGKGINYISLCTCDSQFLLIPFTNWSLERCFTITL